MLLAGALCLLVLGQIMLPVLAAPRHHRRGVRLCAKLPPGARRTALHLNPAPDTDIKGETHGSDPARTRRQARPDGRNRARASDGYARNFLLPRGKALRATEGNKERFETQRAAARGPQPRALKRGRGGRRESSTARASSSSARPARRGQLYGSVSTRDIAETLTAGGFTVERDQIVLNTPIKTLGLHTVPVACTRRSR